MSIGIELDPNTRDLLRSVGAIDGDGHVVGSWFQDPIGGVRKILADPQQRAAFVELLHSLLGDDRDGALHDGDAVPLLDPNGIGNVYITVSGDVIGVAAALSTPADAPVQVTVSVRLPLLDTAGDLTPVAGTADGPLEITLELGLPQEAPATSLSLSATVDLQGHAAFSFVLDGVDVGAGPETLEVNSAHLGRDLVRAVETLVKDALSDVPGVDRLSDHLFGALGLDGVLPALPLDRLASDPAALRGWLAQIASTPADLEKWFAHVSGLLGADAPTAEEPLSARIVALDAAAAAELTLRLAVVGGELQVMLAVVARAGGARLEASGTLLSIPLSGATPVRVVPRAAVHVRAPAGGGILVDNAPDIQVGSLSAGVAFGGHGFVPELLALDVVLENKEYPSLDLTSANAVIGAATQGVRSAIERAIGNSGPGHTLLALLGIVAPASDAGTTHLIDVTALAQGPLAAIAGLHRAVLADTQHNWGHMLLEIASLMGLDEPPWAQGGAAQPDGTATDPWWAEIAIEGELRLEVVAWNARDAATPAGEQRLRLGLRARATAGPWTTQLLSELLAFDLPASGNAAVRLVGRQALETSVSPPDADTSSGLTFHMDAISAEAAWQPGEPFSIAARVKNVGVTVDGDTAGPLTLVFPPANPSAPDLGLGAAIRDLIKLLRLLARHALHAWGGDGAYLLGELLGLYGGGPLLEPSDANDLTSLFTHPGDALRERLRALALELDNDGQPLITAALAQLAALLRDQVPRAADGFAPRLDVPIHGEGTYDHPWAIGLAGEGERAELIAWLDPAGPPASWATGLAGALRTAADASTLVALVPRLGMFLEALPEWLDPDTHADALDTLAHWIASGDGVSPLASQLAAPPGWERGLPLTSPHDAQPADAGAIAQLRAQLDGWNDEDGGRAVLLIGPAWSDHAIWHDLLAAVEPARPGGAHFDLRAGADPAAVTAVAQHYTADLDDDGSGDVPALAAQIATLLDRIVALTGRERVVIVAHSTPGVAARLAAANRPEVVRAVATLGTPHDGLAPMPLTDPVPAEAVRAARSLGSVAAPLQTVVDRLDAALDGVAGAYAAGAFAPPPDGIADAVPGFALGSAVGGDLVNALARSLAARVTAVASSARPAPTHLGIGARVELPLGAPAAGEPAVEALARIDAARIRLVSEADEPPRPPRAVTLHVDAARPGGWLVGDAVGAGPRIRSGEFAVTLVPAAGGGASATPSLVLHDVVLGAAPRRDLELGDDGLGPAVSLIAEAVGARLDPDVLTGLVTTPQATLLAQRDALLDALENVLGGALHVSLASIPIELTLDRASWALVLRSTADLPFGEGVSASFAAGLQLSTMRPTLDATLRVGAISLTHSAENGTLTLSARPWLAPLVLLPAPAPIALRDALVPVIPRLALSAAMSAGLGELLGAQGTVGALDALLADPGARLRELESGDIQALLKAAAHAVGVDDSDGLALPGGFVLKSSGQDPLRLELTGTLDLDAAGDTLGIDLALDVTADRRVAVGGTLTIDVALPGPGTWGRVEAAFSVGSAGVGLVVTPDHEQPITLLPRFSGFGALVQAGATSLLPHLLQAIVEEIHPIADPDPPDGMLGAVLALATDLGIYGPDAQGFEEPARVANLAKMLQPGWIENELNDPAAIARLIVGLFGPPPLLSMPIGGKPVADGDRIRWTAPLPAPASGKLTVTVALGTPAVTVEVDGLAVGPLVVDHARAGFDAGLVLELALGLAPDGELAFLTPEAELGVANDRLTAALLPLGAARRADIEFEFAPAPGVTFTPDGALGLIVEWGVPLVAMLGLSATGSVLDDALWAGGPTARRVLESSGLLVPDPSHGTPHLARQQPPLDALTLGVVEALAAGGVSLGTLDIAIVDDGAGRKGLRLSGAQEIDTGDMTVSMSFGRADWLDDPDAGVTLWLIATRPGQIPELDPGLTAVGLGAMLRNKDQSALLSGPLTIGRAGGLVFFDLRLLNASGQPDVSVSQIGAAVDLRDAQINVDSSDGDSLIQKLLPPELQAPFQLAVSARAGRGLELHGGIGGTPGMIELTFPLDIDLGGIVEIEEVYISAGRAGNAAELIAAISGGANLGPIAMAIERVGLRVDVTPSGAQLGFKAPDGLGLSIDTPTVRAGGFLLIDDVHGRYVGAIELEIAEKFALVAIGIITTMNPDGTPGFSLLFLIAIVFPVPIPLGYGFFFAGAGGLLGLNRGIDLDRLRLGLRAGTAESILFPTDVVARIDQIVRDLEEVFPIAQDRFLVAPMAMITWSTPPLITAEVGVIIEIGSPLRLGLLGLVKLQLPDPEEPVVSLKVAFLGALDIPGSMVSFDASIYDSYLGYEDFKLSLEGDIAVRVCWGPAPDFVTSVGGFHPSFHPAAHLRLPPMRRMSISLLKDNPSITLSSYFALTTNTVQFGAKLALIFKAGDFSVEGELGLDVLVQIVPVHIDAHVYGRVAVKAGGSELLSISLDLSLQGPTPWIAHGTGKFKILFFSVTVTLDAHMGAAAPATLPNVAVLAKLIAALQDDGAWSAQLAAGAEELVHLIPPPDGTLVIDAAGLLTVSQRVVPLATDFTLFGTGTPTDVTRVDVHELRIGEDSVNGTAAPADTRDVTDAFAPAAFNKLSDADKLSSPAFEPRPAGVQSVNGDKLTTDAILGWPVRYETIELDSAASRQPARGTGGPDQAQFEALAPGGVIGSSAGAKSRAREAQKGSVLGVGAAAERYAVARTGDLRPLDEHGAVATASQAGVLVSLTDAQRRRTELIARGLADDLQIVPEAQLAA